MKYDEYVSLAQTLTADNAPTVMGAVLEALKEDTAKIEAYEADIAAKDTKIKDLQDTNIKLFLSQTGKADETNPDDEAAKEKAAVEDEITKLIKGKE